MITLKDIRKEVGIHNIPKNVVFSKNLILDTSLYRYLSTGEGDKEYDFDIYLPKYGINLQRPYVWTHSQQNEFIKSVIQEKPIDPVVTVFNDYADGRKTLVEVIDGKQRLLTIRKFIHNEFPIKIDNNNVYFKDFDPDCVMLLKQRVNSITSNVYSSDDCTFGKQIVTDNMKIILFNYYNFAGTPQAEEHKTVLQNIQYRDSIKKLIENDPDLVKVTNVEKYYHKDEDIYVPKSEVKKFEDSFGHLLGNFSFISVGKNGCFYYEDYFGRGYYDYEYDSDKYPILTEDDFKKYKFEVIDGCIALEYDD